ncbi:hypothetical protein ACSVDA_20495 [Cytobacillus sp. Hm23]
MTKNNSPVFLSTQEEKPIEFPLDGTRVELLRLRIPEHLYGRQAKLDGFFQSNFFVVGMNDNIEPVILPYKYEIGY